MRYIEIYKNMRLDNKENVFKYLIDNLKCTIRTYDFFVAWDKVLDNVSDVEIGLNILNSLIGKNDIIARLRLIIREYPKVVPIIPLLIAVRDKKIKIADSDGDVEYVFNGKSSYTNEEIDRIIVFMEMSGLIKFIQNESIKNLVDYAIGVEVGLDTNARKNRSGIVMERLIELHIKKLCKKYDLEYLTQANAAIIKEKFGKIINIDKNNRQFDFVIHSKNKIYLIEVNYYGSGGSKLKAVSGEFSNLSTLVKNKDTGFIWITDGQGWLTAKKPLEEAFNIIDYVINIKMIEDGILEEIIIKRV